MSSLKEYWDKHEKVEILTESRKRVPSRKHQDPDDSRPPPNPSAKTKSKRKSDGKNDAPSKTNAFKKKANTNQGNITTSAPGGDSAFDWVVMEEDAGAGIGTSALEGVAVSEGVFMEGGTSAQVGDTALEGVMMEAEVAGVGMDANMLGHDATDDAVDLDEFEEELR